MAHLMVDPPTYTTPRDTIVKDARVSVVGPRSPALRRCSPTPVKDAGGSVDVRGACHGGAMTLLPERPGSSLYL